jgi:rubredoxin/desulfoferrodoxin (superoxide reductase-like protein)
MNFICKKIAMRYLCTNCSYIYNEALGDELEGIPSGTSFDELEQDFVCPSCYEEKENFQEIKDEINYPYDSENLSSLEKEHFINYYLEKGVLKIYVGKDEEHSMEKDHFVASIGIYDENDEKVEEKFISSQDDGSAEFNIDYLDEFEIKIYCSQHWWWGSGKINVNSL